MYNITDKSSAIRELQKYLLAISENASIPHLSVDGVFTEETKRAVEEFQKNNFLPVTGYAERKTFDLIYKQYLEALSNKQFTSNEVYPLKIGDSGNDIIFLNYLINELSIYYRDLKKVYGDFFSPDTEASVKLLQQYLLEENTGTVSEIFIKKLENELKERKKFAVK